MQVPEKLALIGGSILLSSTLIFTLKSQASSIIPSVGHSISHVFDHIGDAQQASDFDSNFQRAQQKHWATGHWGTAPYYIDSNLNMYVGSGELSGSLYSLKDAGYLRTVNLVKPVQAPQDSNRLFGMYLGGVNHTLTSINGLDNLDTSQVTNMDAMFCENQALEGLDVSHFNTSHVTDMSTMFGADGAISDLNVSNFDTSNVTNFYEMFMGFKANSLDLSHWDTAKANDIGFDYTDDVHQLTLGTDTKISGNYLHNGTYKNRNQILSVQQLENDQPHPGTWVKQ